MNFWTLANRFLTVVAVCLFVVFIGKYQTGKNAQLSLADISFQNQLPDKKNQPTDVLGLTTKSDYRNVIQARDIFTAASEQKKEDQAPAQPKPALSTRYRLGGIILDKNPTAIIEDLQSHQTIILSIGQKLGDAELKNIQENRAVFRDGDQDVELIR
ncbi:MAG: hypothetical protein HQL23_05550 [Candidatus Omnitrophica bacterium]|nr:hypothetical protein [Candidatus Omnitrophota bacterium]